MLLKSECNIKVLHLFEFLCIRAKICNVVTHSLCMEFDLNNNNNIDWIGMNVYPLFCFIDQNYVNNK